MSKEKYNACMTVEPILLDSITDATPAIRGAVVISGSHGGLYPATLASGFAPRAVFFHDAGIGFESSGIAGVMALADVGVASAAVDCQSCTIGSAREMQDKGKISRVNQVAASWGVRPKMSVSQAAEILQSCPLPKDRLTPSPEVRKVVQLKNKTEVILVDSASLVGPQDAGEIIVTGSHGGLINGDPSRAIKACARIAVFNDAGFGPQEIVLSRLPALQSQGVAAVLLSCRSARIGEALSGLETGVISFTNAAAQELGAKPGTRLKTWLESVVKM
jgi:hypothetical protein